MVMVLLSRCLHICTGMHLSLYAFHLRQFCFAVERHSSMVGHICGDVCCSSAVVKLICCSTTWCIYTWPVASGMRFRPTPEVFCEISNFFLSFFLNFFWVMGDANYSGPPTLYICFWLQYVKTYLLLHTDLIFFISWYGHNWSTRNHPQQQQNLQNRSRQRFSNWMIPRESGSSLSKIFWGILDRLLVWTFVMQNVTAAIQ